MADVFSTPNNQVSRLSVAGQLFGSGLKKAAKWTGAFVACLPLYLVGLENLNPFHMWKLLYRIPLASLTAGLILAAPLIGIPVALIAVGKEVPDLINKVETLIGKAQNQSQRISAMRNNAGATQPPPPGFQPPPPQSNQGPGSPPPPSPGQQPSSRTPAPPNFPTRGPVVTAQPKFGTSTSPSPPFRPGQYPRRPGRGHHGRG